MVTEHYCFVNPYCSCVLSDDLYLNIGILLRHQQKGLLRHSYVIARIMGMRLRQKTVPVPRTGLCVVMVTVRARSRVRKLIGHVDTARLRTLCTIAFGGLDYEIRLHYKLDVLYNIATVTSRASSAYCNAVAIGAAGAAIAPQFRQPNWPPGKRQPTTV